MRGILIDLLRRQQTAKHGGEAAFVITDPAGTDPVLRLDVLRVHEALDRLAERHPRHARVVELRYFGGLSVQETCDVLRLDEDCSVRSVERDWTFARAWLEKELTG